MRTFVIFGSVLLFAVLSCGDPSAKMKKKPIPRQDIVLSDVDIYNGVKVGQFLNNDKKFVSESNKLFLKGTDAFKNKNNLDSAIYYFKASILKEPSAKAYYELGNIHKEKKQYDEAISAYKLAEQLDYQPFYNILYRLAAVNSLQGNEEMSGQYLLYALQAGYHDLDKLDEDEDLKTLKESYSYQRVLKEGIRGMSNPETIAWLQFKKNFSKMPLPYDLFVNLSETQWNELKFISYDFEKFIAEMRDDRFSREVSKGFYFHSQPYENENYVALIYVVKDEFMGEYAPSLYRLATFTHQGKLIDKMEIAGGGDLAGEMRDAKLLAKGKIEISIFNPVYENDPNEAGFWDNPIKSKSYIGKEFVQIDAKGKILAVESSKEISMN